MAYFDETEKNHQEQYEADPEYREKFDALQVERSAEQERIEELQAKTRNEAGRYTLDEAAKFISNNSKASADSILTKLEYSANTNELTVYAPAKTEKYNKRRAVLGWHEEAFWDDLNKWLGNNEPRLGCSFPEPKYITEQAEAVGDTGSGNGAEPKGKKLSKLGKQQAAILEVIKNNALNPMAIPDGKKTGVIQKDCENKHATIFNGSTSFDRAWDSGVGELWRMEYHDSYARRGNN